MSHSKRLQDNISSIFKDARDVAFASIPNFDFSSSTAEHGLFLALREFGQSKEKVPSLFTLASAETQKTCMSSLQTAPCPAIVEEKPAAEQTAPPQYQIRKLPQSLIFYPKNAQNCASPISKSEQSVKSSVQPPDCLSFEDLHSNQSVVQVSFSSLSDSLSLDSSNNRQPTSLYLPNFINDIYYINSFFLEPGSFNIAQACGSLSPLSNYLLSLVESKRSHELRKEQKIKKVFNLVFKQLLKDFRQRFFPDQDHVTEQIKQQFARYYFQPVSDNYHLFTKPDYRSKKMKSGQATNLTYNSQFFTDIKKCPLFVNDLVGCLKAIKAAVDTVIKDDIRALLQGLENCMAKVEGLEEKQSNMSKFFQKRNIDGKKVGIKIPWSRSQFCAAVDLVAKLSGISEEGLFEQ